MLYLDEVLNREIRAATRELPRWNGGPGVDYTHAPVAYAVNVTVVRVRHPANPELTHQEPTALLVQRASGHGAIGTWSGVSGYIDTLLDPRQGGNSRVRARHFDPVDYTIRTELEEECGLGVKAQAGMTFHLGERFQVQSHNGGKLHVVPVLAIYHSMLPPMIRLSLAELSAYQWVPRSKIAGVSNLNPGYRAHTLPRIEKVLQATVK